MFLIRSPFKIQCGAICDVISKMFAMCCAGSNSHPLLLVVCWRSDDTGVVYTQGFTSLLSGELSTAGSVLGAPCLRVRRSVSDTRLLCDLGEVTLPLWFSVSLAVT